MKRIRVPVPITLHYLFKRVLELDKEYVCPACGSVVYKSIIVPDFYHCRDCKRCWEECTLYLDNED